MPLTKALLSMANGETNGKLGGFFRLTFQGLLQIIVMVVLLLNWWDIRQTNNVASSTALGLSVQQDEYRIKNLEESNKEVSSQMSEIQRKVDVLVAIAEEQHKK